MKKNKLKITQVKSSIGCKPVHKATLKGLGLRRCRHSVVLQDTPEIRGMVNQVSYLIKIEDS